MKVVINPDKYKRTLDTNMVENKPGVWGCYPAIWDSRHSHNVDRLIRLIAGAGISWLAALGVVKLMNDSSPSADIAFNTGELSGVVDLRCRETIRETLITGHIYSTLNSEVKSNQEGQGTMDPISYHNMNCEDALQKFITNPDEVEDRVRGGVPNVGEIKIFSSVRNGISKELIEEAAQEGKPYYDFVNNTYYPKGRESSGAPYRD